MKLSKLAVVTSVTMALSLLTAIPAEARMTPGPIASESASDAVGLIVKYKPAVNPIAPNGEPTGENYAGVDLENSKDLGGGFKSVEFANDLTPEEMIDALDRIKMDPRVATASLNRVFEAANYVAKPIAASILPGTGPLDLPIVLKSAVRVAAAPVASAVDAWRAPNVVTVKLTWRKPTTRVSGKIAGFKVQIFAAGSWRTLVSKTRVTTRSYTTSSSYLKAGVRSLFRVAAVNYYAKRYYTGRYRTVGVTPSSAPNSSTNIQVQNGVNEIRYSWAPLTTATEQGGLAVTYNLNVQKDGAPQPCAVATPTTCVISPVVPNSRYSATLTISNSRGSVSPQPVSFTFTSALAVTNDDQYFNNQWHLNSDPSSPYGMKVSNAWLTESGARDVYVAILDTGITSHPDLNENVVSGYDFVSDAVSARDNNGWDSNPQDEGDNHYDANNRFVPSSWHGTHVAGIVAAADNSIGVLGVAPNVKIIPVRVLAAEGGTEADIVAGLNWVAGNPINGVNAIQYPVDVINMSIGGISRDRFGDPVASCGSLTQNVLAAIKNKGITVVTAAGNDSLEAIYSYPGNCYPTLNVSATGPTGKPTFYSNYGAAVDIAAPGGDYCYAVGSQQATGQIFSTWNDGNTIPGNPDYRYELGTSMASPNVAGTVALMYSALFRQNPTTMKNSTLVNKIWDALLSSVTPLAARIPPAEPYSPNNGNCRGSSALAQSYGAGIVNAEAAIAAILR